MRGDTAHRLDVERACLRLRLAAAALATTLALVALPRADAFAAVVIPIALAAAVVLRYLDPGRAPTARIAAGHVVDVVLASGMVYALPVASPAWILYGFVIAIAALRHGPMGAFAGTAASIIAYDLTLFVRAEEAPIDALWNVQALVAVGLVGAELAWATVRSVTERERIRRHATAGDHRRQGPHLRARHARHAAHRTRSRGVGRGRRRRAPGRDGDASWLRRAAADGECAPHRGGGPRGRARRRAARDGGAGSRRRRRPAHHVGGSHPPRRASRGRDRAFARGAPRDGARRERGGGARVAHDRRVVDRASRRARPPCRRHSGHRRSRRGRGARPRAWRAHAGAHHARRRGVDDTAARAPRRALGGDRRRRRRPRAPRAQSRSNARL